MNTLLNNRSGGLPWMTILDRDGEEIISSNGPRGNIGCPVEPFEIDHFVEMIEASTDADKTRLTAIRDALTANAKKLRGE